mgnify:CR=1 FL=1
MVSILTRPEGRVQQFLSNIKIGVPKMFQSSPVPRDGCNEASRVLVNSSLVLFQSSPVPRDGCN